MAALQADTHTSHGRAVSAIHIPVWDSSKKLALKNREAGFCAGLNRLAETFSLYKSLSSPQQLIAVTPHSTDKYFFVNTRKLA
jgi:hypothetical protein